MAPPQDTVNGAGVRPPHTTGGWEPVPHPWRVIGIMTAYQESDLLVLSTPSVPDSLDYPHQGRGLRP